MSVDTYDFVHLALHALGGQVEGKTKLQKTMFFLGILTGCEEDLGYRAHFYGPYSDDVAHCVGQLCALGFLEHSPTCWGVDFRGFERVRTDYRLTQDGLAIAEDKARRFPDLWGKMKEAVTIFAQAGNLDYMSLSIAAKTYYLLKKKGGESTDHELAELARQFKWSVTQDEVKSAARYLQSLKLVSLAEN